MSSFEKGDGEAVPPPFPADSVKVCGWQKLRRSRSAVCIVLFLSGKGLSPCVEKFPGGSARINVSEQGGTEYGGIGLVMKEHLWEPDRNWGYVRLNSPKEVTDEYEKYADMLYKLIGRGFAAAVYTQTTDVEVEVNGLMTYDRKVMKVEPERIRRINERICNALNK